jgi:hypothetical protein
MRRQRFGALLVLSAALCAGCGGAGGNVTSKATAEEGNAAAKAGLMTGSTDMSKSMQIKPKTLSPMGTVAPPGISGPSTPEKKK